MTEYELVGLNPAAENLPANMAEDIATLRRNNPPDVIAFLETAGGVIRKRLADPFAAVVAGTMTPQALTMAVIAEVNMSVAELMVLWRADDDTRDLMMMALQYTQVALQLALFDESVPA
jgi:hypothetical protein